MRNGLIFCFAMLVASASVAQAAAPLTAKLDAAVRAEVPRGFSGAVLVARGGRILLDRGYGAIRSVQMQPGTRFWIASGGKQFVSAAILTCQALGWLTLDDPVSRFFPDAPADKRDITVRQLLAHLSGIPQGYAAEGVSGRDQAVARILAVPLAAKPGEKFMYANDNYQLSSAIVEVASGMDYHRFVHTRLLAPWRLRDTGFAGEVGARPVAPAVEETPERLRSEQWGDAGVYSTTRDLWNWYRALSAGRVLPARETEMLFAPAAKIQEGHAAFGWFLNASERGHRFVFTRGNDDFGANALLYAYPDSGTVIVVLTHAGMADDNTSWSRRILGRLQDVLAL